VSGLSGPIGRLLSTLDGAPPSDAVAVLATFLADASSATDVALLLVDYDLAVLQMLRPGEQAGPYDSVAVDGSEPGEAFVTQAPVFREEAGGGVWVWSPVTLRAERLGVVQMRLPEPPDDDFSAGLGQLGAALAHVILSAARYTDVFERARRSRRFSLAAEMQWSMLPVRSYSGREFAVAGQLVPAYQVGGDNFDYAVDSDRLRMSVIDAMGHGLRASLLSTLAVTALRNGRRSGDSLLERVTAADTALYRQFGGEQFVTALLLEIELATGEVSVVNAGQPGLLLVDATGVRGVPLDSQLPLGLFQEGQSGTGPHEVQRFSLQRGARLVVVSDGLLEATPPQGGAEFAEIGLPSVLAATTGHAANEAVRLTILDLMAHCSGRPRDDATLLILDWHGR